MAYFPAASAAPATRHAPSRKHLLKAEDWLGLAVVTCLIVLVLGPLATVLIQAFVPGLFTSQNSQAGFSGLLEVFSRPLWQRSLTNSLFLATVAAVVGTVLGCALALSRQSANRAVAAALDIAAWAIIILPSFILAQGWMLFATRGGLANQWLGLSFVPDLVFNPWGLAVIMSLKAFPFAYLAVSAALQWRMDDYVHAARLCGASPIRVLMTIRIPMLLPAALSGAVLIFIDVLGDFGLPAALATTYRFPTLTYAIYVAINQSPIRFDLAGVLAFYVTAIMLAAVIVYFWILRNRRFDFLGGKARLSDGRGSHSRSADIFALVTLLVALVIPVGSSVLVSFTGRISDGFGPGNLTLANYFAVLETGGAFLSALQASLGIAALSALGSGILAAAAAYVVTFSDFRLNRLIDLTCTLSLAVPGVVLGIGYIFVWNSPVLDSLGLRLYGSPSILVLAGVAGAIPIAIRLVLGAMAQVPANMLSAAALQGAGLWRRIGTIVIPLVAAALVSATLTAFGSAIFDLAINSILRPPRLDVLPVYVNRAFEQGQFGAATAATLVAGGITIAILVSIRFATDRAIRRLLRTQPIRDNTHA
ncbi:iron(III) transport system permease protein [Devosia crocina]|uniref:Iron(III) transport system permease protein n=1 Tax=Devosia crocina TaxID=429728 RepID=A0A1I7NV31_9HYPH|nr:ABC transporter permease subunit [Devosia crocina]SFV38521.1 iron(III) transport system permease protein [Devosia crocina]